MNKSPDSLGRDWDALAEDARVLLSATVDHAEQKVVEARKRLSSALDEGRGIYSRVRTGVIDTARMTDKCVREHPYADLGFAFCAGALIGSLLTRSNGD